MITLQSERIHALPSLSSSSSSSRRSLTTDYILDRRMVIHNKALLQTRGGGWLSGRKAAAETAAATDNSTAVVVEEVPEKDVSSPDAIAANEESPSEETTTETTTPSSEPTTSVGSDEEGDVKVASEETEQEQEPSTVSVEIVGEKEQAEEVEEEQDEKEEEEGEEGVPSETAVIVETTENDTTQISNMNEDTSNSLTLQEILEQAAALRKQGKLSHDDGRFSDAAAQFHEAANLLDAGFEKEEAMEESEDDNSSSSSDENTSSPKVNLQNEWATCRLHESLCHLKAEDYEQCIEACSSLLDTKHMVEGKTRARAHHRRAKAKVAVDDIDGALVDARSAAMLGDQKAVAYYGNLLRDTGRSDATMLATPASPMSGAGGFPDSSSLLESLLNKSGPAGNSGGNPSDFLTSSLLGSLTGSPMSEMGGSPGGGGLAKSVISSLSKKLEDESTHDGICQYLQSTNPMQVQSMATMAGVPLSNGQATKLVSIAHGITPKTIRTTVKTTKRAIWGVQLIRKTMAVISKYRTVLLFVALLQFTKSAILRPIPVPKVKAPRAPRRGRGAKAPTTGAPPKPNPCATTGNAGGKPKPATPGIINNNLAAAVGGR